MASNNGSAAGTGSGRMRGGSAPPAHPKSMSPDAALTPPAADAAPAWPSSGGSKPKPIPDRRGRQVPNPGPIGEYAVLEEIGRGGMGVVYRVKNPFFNTEQALKIIGDRLNSKAGRARFIDEMRTHAGLRHTNIIEVFYAGVHRVKGQPDQYYFVMSLEPGDLTQRVKPGGSSEPAQEAEIVRRLCKALSHAHSEGVLHRDLKPQNVLLGKDGTPKVTDFGLMKLVAGAPEGRAGEVVIGTAEYMPPEHARGDADQADARSDVYGLGAILYELLTGRPPYKGATPEETLLCVKARAIKPELPRTINPAVPARLEAICMKCLEKEPAKRYQTADDLERALDEFGRPSWIVRKWHWIAALSLVALLCALLANEQYKQFRAPREAARQSKRHGDAASTVTEQIKHYKDAAEKYQAILAPGFVVARDDLQAELDGVRDELHKRYRADVGNWKQEADAARKGPRHTAIDKYKVYARNLGDLHAVADLPADLQTELTLERGRAMTTLGDLHTSDRNYDEANRALDEAERLLAESSDRECQLAFAEVHHVRGNGHAGRYEWSEALDHFQKGLRLRKENRPPDDERVPDRLYRRNLARSHGYLGDAQRMTGQLDGALASYTEASNIRKQLADAPDATAADKCLHARDFDNLAELADWQRKVADAVKHRDGGLKYYAVCGLGFPTRLPAEYRTERANRVLDYAELVLDDPSREPPIELETLLVQARQEFQDLRTGPSENDPDLRSGEARAQLAWARYQLAWVRHHNSFEGERLKAVRLALAAAARLLVALDLERKAEPTDYYNWAAVLALQGQLAPGPEDRAVCFVLVTDRLEKAIGMGYRKVVRFRRDRAFVGFQSNEVCRKRLENLADDMTCLVPRPEAR